LGEKGKEILIAAEFVALSSLVFLAVVLSGITVWNYNRENQEPEQAASGTPKYEYTVVDSGTVGDSDIAQSTGNVENADEVDSRDAASTDVIARSGKTGGKISIEPQVLLQQSGVTITAQEYVTDSFWGDGIRILTENQSGHNITVGCTALIVNDYMITDLFAVNVADGKKDQSVIYFLSSELKAAGIERIGKIEIYFHIYDSDSWDDLYNSGCITIQTSDYDNMDSTPDDMGQELYNANGIRIVGKEVDEDSFWGMAVLLYIENNSGRNIVVSCDDLSVNDYMMTPLFVSTVYNGKKAIDDITIFSSELEENGITYLERVEFTLQIRDNDTYEMISDTAPIQISTQ
jgi:hypothetical protein